MGGQKAQSSHEELYSPNKQGYEFPNSHRSNKSIKKETFAKYDRTQGSIEKEKAKKQTDDYLSIYSFEMEKEPQSEEEEQLEANRLIKQLKEIGIDVFEYADMTHSDRNSNVRVHDVIQIYRIFNNLRDSGEDAIDEIKLMKLRTFPFFSDSEYESLEKKAIENLHEQNMFSAAGKEPELPPLSPVVEETWDFQDKIQQPDDEAPTFERHSVPNSVFYPGCTAVDSGDTCIVDWVYEDAHFSNLSNDRPSRTSAVKIYLKVNFRQFFKVMQHKLVMQKMSQQDVVFEDKQQHVSCFLWAW